MPKKLCMVIENCKECPYVTYSSSLHTFVCRHNDSYNNKQGIKLRNDSMGVPSWCPLPENKVGI